MLQPTEARRAAAYLGKVNLEVVKRAGARRTGNASSWGGDRPPVSLAGDRVALVEIKTKGADGKTETLTERGTRTARRLLPRWLQGLADDDPRLGAAMMLATAVERIGSVGGGGGEGGDTSGGISDGGVTTKIKHAERLRQIEALANGWPYHPRQGGGAKKPRILLEVQRAAGNRQEIQAFPALVAACVHGADLDKILSAHGWSVHTRNSKMLRVGLLKTLDDVAEGLGLGRVHPKSA